MSLLDAASPVAAVTTFDDDAWEDLLNFIEEKQVIPIVGPELVVVHTEAGPENLYAWIARSLAARQVQTIRGVLGQVWFAQRRFAEAEPHLLARFSYLKSRPPQATGPTGETAQSVARQTAESHAELYTATNQPAKAAEWKKTAAGLAAPPPPARKQPAKK